MNEIEPELLESDLARLRPAQPPEEFMARLARLAPVRPAVRAVDRVASRQPFGLWQLLRLLAPTAAVAVVLALILSRNSVKPGSQSSSQMTQPSPQAALNADNVEIDHQLITDFDTVAQLPSGEPVRFRCRGWLDAVVLRDSGREVSIEQSAPRVEVVPVRFEVY